MATETTSVLTVKMNRVFDFLDVNNDGLLSHDDIAAIADRLAGAFDPPVTGEKVERLKDAFADLWNYDMAHMDTDGDGAVDRGEFAAGMESAAAGGGFLQRFDAMIEAWMSVCDLDGDGRVDLAEFTQMYRNALRVPEPQLQVAFAKLDRDGDGYLNREELSQATREYYTSDDPQTPGNWLFGPL